MLICEAVSPSVNNGREGAILIIGDARLSAKLPVASRQMNQHGLS
jgi:hypothetical protein